MDVLDPLRRSRATTAIFLDFDGTLSPIVPVAAEARPLPDVPALLLELRAAFGRVAIVSGRPVSYLVEHVPAGIELQGLYGLEAIIDGELRHHAGVEGWRPVIDEAARAASATLAAGIDVEHKGLSLTLHFRQQPEEADTVRSWALDAVARWGLHLRPAKMSLELHPPVEVDKGSVIEARAEGMTAAVYMGDDEGDRPAFDALDALAARGVHTVKVAVRTTEVSPALLAQADVLVDGPEGAVALLRSLL